MNNQNQDSIQRFLFEHSNVRGEIVHLNESYLNIINKHNYPTIISHLLGETLVAAALLTATIKFKGQLTIQLQSSGIVNLLVAKCSDQFAIRGLLQFDADKLESIADGKLLGDGQLVVTIEHDEKVQSYQSIIPIIEDGIAVSLEHYFAQSEQLATKIWLTADEFNASGMLLQLMPGDTKSRERENFWEYAVKLGETISDEELQTLANETILHRLYHEEDIRLFEPKSIHFACTCNRKRMQNAIELLGEQEAKDILASNQQIIVTCEFCNQEYAFDKIDVSEIFLKSN